ncbi:MAG: hypothetical protein AAFR32_04460, partial [Pseudomonadota bacterium]
MTAAPTTKAGMRLPAISVSRCERGFEVRWQRDGRPTLRQFSDLGSAIGQAYTLAALLDQPVLDLTAEQTAE